MEIDSDLDEPIKNERDMDNVSPRTASGTATETDSAGETVPSDAESHGQRCKILGHASIGRASLNGDEPAESTAKMTERLLRSLLKRFPFGRIFNFDDRGSSPQRSLDEDNGGLSDTKSIKKLRPGEDKMMRKLFPGIRSLIVMPMYDVHRQRNFAGTFVWTTDQSRVFSSEQALTYLAAFSDSVMAEVGRIEAKIGERTKETFISSVSHELRSPL